MIRIINSDEPMPCDDCGYTHRSNVPCPFVVNNVECIQDIYIWEKRFEFELLVISRLERKYQNMIVGRYLDEKDIHTIIAQGIDVGGHGDYDVFHIEAVKRFPIGANVKTTLNGVEEDFDSIREAALQIQDD